ncbi:MAG: hypothetical protein ABIP46_07585 [Polaromonas sp.]
MPFRRVGFQGRAVLFASSSGLDWFLLSIQYSPDSASDMGCWLASSVITGGSARAAVQAIASKNAIKAAIRHFDDVRKRLIHVLLSEKCTEKELKPIKALSQTSCVVWQPVVFTRLCETLPNPEPRQYGHEINTTERGQGALLAAPPSLDF